MATLEYSTAQQKLNDNRFARYYNIVERPSASLFGVGQCQIAGDFYLSDGISWSLSQASINSTADTRLTLLEKEVVPTLISDNKTIVVLGSSTAAGVGSSLYAGLPNNNAYPVSSTSWVGLFSTAMVAKGYTVVNQSIPGTQTADSIARFYKDVSKFKPKFVFLATSIWNEPNIQSGYIAATKLYLDNIYTLCRMVESIGAIPVLLGPYPSWMADATSYPLMKALYATLERIAPVIADFMGVVDAGTGTWQASTTVDYTHPNDLGHAAFFDAINLTMFDQLGSNRLNTTDQTRGYWQLGASSNSVSPMTINLDRGAKSWTVRSKVRPDVYAQSKAFFSGGVGATAYWRVRNPTTTPYTLTDTIGNSDLVVSSVNPSDLLLHDIVVTYNHISNSMKLYIDGILVNSGTPTYAVTAMTDFCIGGRVDSVSANAVSTTFGEIGIWRTVLNADDISEMYTTSRIPTKSLEVLPTLSTKPDLTYTPNAASTKTLILTPSIWAKVANPILPIITATPATSGAAGAAGTIVWDASYVYVCIAANTWKRSAISTW
jgi:lysophospholipase L1-like esterase